MSRLAMAVVALGASVLAGCASDVEPEPTEQSTPQPDATFVPGGGAEDNKAFFDQTLSELIDANPDADSRTLVNTLEDAGFDKSRMEVTFDSTTVDLEVAYVIVAVKMPDDVCLIGQNGTRGFSSLVAEPLSATGQCLVGVTQTIDW